MTTTLSLRPYQASAVEETYRALAKKGEIPLIVMPTGTGKSVVIAQMCADVPGKIIVLAPKKELVEQNLEKFISLSSEELPSVGINCAGLNERDFTSRVIFATIQSVYKSPYDFGAVDLVIIDEAHQMPKDDTAMYQSFITKMQKVCPDVRIVGLTATPGRLAGGHLLNCSIFTAISFEYAIKEAIADGYLSPLVSDPQEVLKCNWSDISVPNGEYDDVVLESYFEDREVLETIAHQVNYLISTGERRKGILFAQTLHFAKELMKFITVPPFLIDYTTSPEERRSIIKQFRGSSFRGVLINKEVASTGFDVPDIDLVVLAMATKSKAGYVQKCGRGTRIHPSKKDCLVLDFGHNITEHGPVDQIEWPFKSPAQEKAEKGVQKHGELFVYCETCMALSPIGSETCVQCGEPFKKEFSSNLYVYEDRTPILTKPLSLPVYKWWAEYYGPYGKPPMMVFRFQVVLPWKREGLETVSNYVCLFHTGYARNKSRAWLKKYICFNEYPSDDAPYEEKMTWILDACEIINENVKISHIRFEKDKQYWRILDAWFDPNSSDSDGSGSDDEPYEELPF